MLTGKRPELRDIVIFGSPCTVHLATVNKSLNARGKAAIITGINDEMNGYRVYIPKERVVVVIQHVQNVETLNDFQGIVVQEDHDVKYDNNKTTTRSLGWTCDRHMTRSTQGK